MAFFGTTTRVWPEARPDPRSTTSDKRYASILSLILVQYVYIVNFLFIMVRMVNLGYSLWGYFVVFNNNKEKTSNLDVYLEGQVILHNVQDG